MHAVLRVIMRLCQCLCRTVLCNSFFLAFAFPYAYAHVASKNHALPCSYT